MSFQKLWKSSGIIISLVGLMLTGLISQGTIQTDDGVISSAISSISSPSIGSKVMLQAFYWNTPQYIWYDAIDNTLSEINDTGFDAIWLPPPSKAQGGGGSMGYDPYDYYDLGEYNQKGAIATRFGVKSQLISLFNHSRSLNLSVIGDLVLNHNSGGNLEFNPNTNSNTYTDFSSVASNTFSRGYDDFHPSSYESSDEGVFGGFPDLCHTNPYVHDGLISWGEWLRDDIGYRGWRFDYVKGYHASMVEDWMNIIGGWGVAEFWDGNKDLIFDYLDSTNNKVSAFDFPLYYTLR
ncbi:MAG: alpha-amylase family glycosyl hydrolase, partial [Candidatus Hodarchaeales archaeon]